MLISSTVSSANELQQILQLQQQYLRGTTSAEEEKEQGFLTVAHTYDALLQMHQLEPSVIVKDGDELAGYALSMHVGCRQMVPELVPMFENLDHIKHNGKLLNDYSFYIMGQICVAKAWRGHGIVKMLYEKHKEAYQQRYDFIVTEISARNHRSLHAHKRAGFEVIHEHTDHIDDWLVVLWDWR